MSETYDVVIAGAGHNALILGCYLAKAGVDVIVYEPTAKYQNVAKRTGVQELTATRALIAQENRRYARRSRAIDSRRKALGREFSVVRSQHGSKDHDLASEFALEEIRIVAFDAGAQIGERECRDAVTPTFKVQGQRIRRGPWDAIAGQRHTSIFCQHRFNAECARCQFEGHCGWRFTGGRKHQGHLPNHVIGIRYDVQRPDILLTYRDPLPRRRPLAAELLAQHDLAGGSAFCQ